MRAIVSESGGGEARGGGPPDTSRGETTRNVGCGGGTYLVECREANHGNRQMFESYALLIFAYLLGSISSAILLSRIMGFEDPRRGGSNNPGATNVLRIAGKKAAFFTLLGDFLKGLLPVLLGHAAGVDLPWLALIGFAAFAGHCFPVFFGFRGGKGVATAIAATVAFHWIAGAALVASWLLIAGVFRISSVAAIVSFTALPPLIYWLTLDMPTTGIFAAMSAILVWRHRGNIQRLLRGTES